MTFTLLMSVLSVGSVVGALATARRPQLGVHGVSLGALAFGVAMAVLAAAPNQPVAYADGFVVGLTSIAFMTSSTAIVQTRAIPSMRGRVLALQAMVFLGSTPIGGPIVGTIAEAFGARDSVALGAAGTLVAGAYGLLAARRDRGTAADEVVLPPGEPVLVDPLITPRAS
ncbi:MAG: MFS transporter [Acidimicrobiales bacterium]